jgi:putative hydrolase of the HAD superfamily
MLSMIETAAQLSGGRIESGIIQAIISIGKGMLMTEVQPFEHAKAVLAELSQSHQLMLITKGDTFEQERKIKRSDLSRYFHYIDILSEKSAESYRTLLDKYRIDPGRFLMVGNSIRSDILPVIRIGGKAVYIPYEHTWSHEMIDEPLAQEGAYYKVENLGELVGLVKRLDTRDTFGKDNS